MPLQWRNQIWQSLEEGAGKRGSECAPGFDVLSTGQGHTGQDEDCKDREQLSVPLVATTNFMVTRCYNPVQHASPIIEKR